MKEKVIIMLSIMALVVSGCGADSKSENEEEIIVGENQELKYVMVTNRNGNEITYTEVDETMAQKMEERKSGQEKDEQSQLEGEKEEGETVTLQISVGVTVHTSTGTDTTFSRIEAGDILKILFEEDEDGNMEIVEIWMV